MRLFVLLSCAVSSAYGVTCTGFACPIGRSTVANPGSVMCGGAICGVSECCTRNTCAGGPTNPAPQADYARCRSQYGCKTGVACNLLSTDGICDTGCLDGYSKAAGSSFTLTCSAAGTYTDLSSTGCSPNACLSGPFTPASNVDYSACNNLTTGGVCTPSCEPGYSGAAPSSFAVICTGLAGPGFNYADVSGISCNAIQCTTGPSNPAANVMYGSCVGQRTGSLCAPTCSEGYTMVTGSSFFIVCLPTGSFVDSSSTTCSPSSCASGPTTAVAAADYTSCNALATASTCSVSCRNGYEGSGVAFTLLCIGRRYTDSSGAVCSPRQCTSGPVAPSLGVDYRTCTSLSTGGTCSPTCLPGYQKASGNSFVLQCAVGGVYIDSSSTVCTRIGCMNGPTNAQKGVDYTSCNALSTGGVCNPTCLSGYSQAVQGASFTVLCSISGYIDQSGLTCRGNTCVAGPTNPSTGVSYSSCTSLVTGDTCRPTCLAGHVKLKGQDFTLTCLNNMFSDSSGVACVQEFDECTTVCAACPNGTSICSGSGQACHDPDFTARGDWTCTCVLPSKGSPGTTSPAQCTHNECETFSICSQVGQTCTDPNMSPQSLGDWYCSCISPAVGTGVATAATCTFQGECLQYSSTCTSQGQTCHDPTAQSDDWQCLCVSPLTGVAATRSPASCSHNECTSNTVCANAAQQCYDPDTSSRSLNDWQCLCAPPMTGLQTGAVATCTLNECDTHIRTCAAVGQTCLDQNTDPASKDDWLCLCVNAVGSAVGTPATCEHNGECVPYSSVCTSRGQACLDPSISSSDWRCECIPPQVGTPRQAAPASCTYDECNNPVTSICSENNQFCNDPDTSPASTDDWTCSCKAPSIGSKKGGAAQCVLDECGANRATCSAVGQICTDRNTAAASVGDWECSCATPGTGAAIAKPASCTFGGECVPYSSVCTSEGQNCVDLSAAIGDWQCQCVPPQTGTSATAGPTVCVLDECSIYNTCQQANQVCDDPNLSPGSQGDWRCSCRPPSVGVAVGTAATCVLDECITTGNVICNSKGQLCSDPDTSPEILNDWVCSCVNPAVGSAVLGIATCVETGECVPYSSVCTNQGQACSDPSTNSDDWICACVSPADGVSQVGKPAVCVLDECTTGVRCPDGQQCLDPDVRPQSTGDWECVCNAPSIGKLRGGAASCMLDECMTRGSICLSAGQECHDPNTGTANVGDWMCRCVAPANGSAVTAAAQCTFNGECAAYQSQCTKLGQTCVDPTTTFDDWECRCVTPQTGTPATMRPAACVFDECLVYSRMCEGKGQTCFDPNTSPSLTGDWECRCPPPTTGSAIAATALCVFDECMSLNISSTCSGAGQTCHDPQTAVNSINDWTCNCVAPAVGSSIGASAVCVYDGECLANSGICTAVGQTCVDPFPTVDDWQCACVAPAVGRATTRSPAQCEIDECKSRCPTCASTACSDVGQTCTDPDTSYSSLGDWTCSCIAPSTGKARGRAASCARDECSTNVQICAAVGQVCMDPNKSDKSLDDWKCMCVLPSTGEALKTAATCAVSGECQTVQTICTQQGQYCDDPSTGSDDWMCKCPPPQVGDAVVRGTTACVLDECSVACSTCADTGTGNVCAQAGQTCFDPNTSPSSTMDWRCVCPSPLTNVSSEAKPASCTIDECSVSGSVCSAAGQLCKDPDTNPSATSDWRCECAPPSVGVAVAQAAVCSYSGECVPYSSICTDAGQACIDPSSDAGDWACGCVYPYTGAPSAAMATVCELNECLAPCPTCADSGSGNVCEAAGQTCVEGSTASDSLNDWRCVCVLPLQGSQVIDAAECTLDECKGNSVCSSQGQQCNDQDTSPNSVNDWRCECVLPATGSAVRSVAACKFTGECVPYSPICTQVGQTCNDPSDAMGDWQCLCVAPQVGPAGVGKTANCSKDECDDVTVCREAGQDCVDPDTSPGSLGDWRCTCRSPSAGSAVGKAAICGLDECVVRGSVCVVSGQTCIDSNKVTLNDWVCECPPPSQGRSVAGIATCTLNECTTNGTVCTSVGQECIDSNTAASSLNDWRCQCIDGSNAAQGAPALCPFDECTSKQGVCPAGQNCQDTNNTAASLNDWQCVCVAPYQGQPVTMQAAQCSLDECTLSGSVCTAAGQSCADPNLTKSGDWECVCNPPLNGQNAKGRPADCNFDECTADTVCVAAQQLCTDPNQSVNIRNDWQCSCKPPSTGASSTGSQAACSAGIDECLASGAICAAAGQSCKDPNTSLTGDWLCVCSAPFQGFGQRSVATCTLDECVANGDICSKVGQTCFDPNTSAATTSDWICSCVSPSSGSQTGGQAVCTHPNQLCATCAAQGLACQSDVGGWRCVCPVGSATFVPPCVFDECAVTCNSCANKGYGNLCGLEGQRCVDPSPILGSTNDWRCECTTPYTGAAVGSAASCVVDECFSNAGVCTTVGQSCMDPSGTMGDWTCQCKAPLIGQAVGTPATCVAAGCAVCQGAGQACTEQGGQVTCHCKPPGVGSAVGTAAVCTVDECEGNSICSAAGQQCRDPSSSVPNNWVCSCMNGLVGERVGAVATCATGCSNLANPCFAAGQVCIDNSPGVTCECTGSSTGKANGAAAVCSFQGVCANHSMVCTDIGQACYVPQGSDIWSCVCVPPAVGTAQQGGPTMCIIDECEQLQPSCGANQTCTDPNKSARSLADWYCACDDNTGVRQVGGPVANCEPVVNPPKETVTCDCGVNQTCTTDSAGYQCTCVAPLKGTNVANGPADCYVDECISSGSVCTAADQTCEDPSGEDSNWECRCVAPLSGTGTAQVATCTAPDQCSSTPCGEMQTCNTTGPGAYTCTCQSPQQGEVGVNKSATCAAPSEDDKWYETWWVWVLIALLLLCCCYMLYWLIINSQKQEEKQEEQESAPAEPLIQEPESPEEEIEEEGSGRLLGYVPPPPPPPPSLPSSEVKAAPAVVESDREGSSSLRSSTVGTYYPLPPPTSKEQEPFLYPAPPAHSERPTVLHELHTLLSGRNQTNPLNQPVHDDIY